VITFIQTLSKAIALGSIYAIMALSFVIIFKGTQVLNFAAGAISMAGALFLSIMVATPVGRSCRSTTRWRQPTVRPPESDAGCCCWRSRWSSPPFWGWYWSESPSGPWSVSRCSPWP